MARITRKEAVHFCWMMLAGLPPMNNALLRPFHIDVPLASDIEEPESWVGAEGAAEMLAEIASVLQDIVDKKTARVKSEPADA